MSFSSKCDDSNKAPYIKGTKFHILIVFKTNYFEFFVARLFFHVKLNLPAFLNLLCASRQLLFLQSQTHDKTIEPALAFVQQMSPKEIPDVQRKAYLVCQSKEKLHSLQLKVFLPHLFQFLCEVSVHELFCGLLYATSIVVEEAKMQPSPMIDLVVTQKNSKLKRDIYIMDTYEHFL